MTFAVGVDVRASADLRCLALDHLTRSPFSVSSYQSTSGANETAHERRSRAPRKTGPKMRLPAVALLVMSTAAFSSNLM